MNKEAAGFASCQGNPPFLFASMPFFQGDRACVTVWYSENSVIQMAQISRVWSAICPANASLSEHNYIIEYH